jgi:hypothetical protein
MSCRTCQASCPIGTRNSFSIVKQSGNSSDHSPPSSAECRNGFNFYHIYWQKYIVIVVVSLGIHLCFWGCILLIKPEVIKDLRFSWWWLWRMPSSRMLHHVALVGTDISEERSASLIRVTRISEVGTTLAITINRLLVFLCSMHWLLVTANVPSSPILVTLMMEALRSLNRWFLQESHSITSQKMAFFREP